SGRPRVHRARDDLLVCRQIERVAGPGLPAHDRRADPAVPVAHRMSELVHDAERTAGVVEPELHPAGIFPEQTPVAGVIELQVDPALLPRSVGWTHLDLI